MKCSGMRVLLHALVRHWRGTRCLSTYVRPLLDLSHTQRKSLSNSSLLPIVLSGRLRYASNWDLSCNSFRSFASRSSMMRSALPAAYS